MMKKAISIVAVLLLTLGAAFAQQGAHNSNDKSPEEFAKTKTERMTKKLKLTESQSKSVYSILLESAINKNEIMARYPEMEKAQAEMKASKNESRSKVQSILTPEQKEKQKEIRQSSNKKGKGQKGDSDPDKMLKQMKTDLELTDQQMEELEVVFENASKNRAEMKSKYPELEQAKKEMEKNKEDTQTQLEKVLSAEQNEMLQKKGPTRKMKGKK